MKTGISSNKAKDSLKILCIADLHFYEECEIEAISDFEYDVCLLLGDIPHSALLSIKKANGSHLIYGICGNHDDWQSLSSVGIEDIHCKAIQIGNYRIVGFGGSCRYKNGDYAMMTQKESIIYASNIPLADIIISHDCPYKLFKKFRKDTAHQGLKGISKYIAKCKPKLNLCGHYHESIQAQYRKCKVECIYRFKLLSINL